MILFRLARPRRARSFILLALTASLSGSMLSAAGCSTAPCADFLDWCKPGTFPANPKGAGGGVCVPQGGGVAGLNCAVPVVGTPPGPGAPFVPPGPALPMGPTGVPDAPAPAPIGATPLSTY